jgi:hypothetical protein
MSDESNDNESLDVEFTPDEQRSEVFEWSAPSGKGGVYIFPKGVEAWAEENGVELVHIDQTTGVVTVQHELGTSFRQIDKALNTGALAAIRDKK